MNFKTAGLIIGASTALRLFGGVLTVKVIAISTGPEGLGQLGQLMSLLAVCVMLAAGGTQNGVIVGLAQREKDGALRQRFWNTACTIGAITSISVAAAILTTATQISVMLFKSKEFTTTIQLLSIVQLTLAFSTLISGQLISNKETKNFAITSSLSVVAGLSGLTWLSWNWGVQGAAYGLLWSASCPAIIYGIHHIFCRNYLKWEKFSLQKDEYLYLGKFSLMVLISAISMPIVQIILRNYLLEQNGWPAVGGWQAALRYSDASLQFISVLLSSYFLPRISSIKDSKNLRLHVNEAYKFLMPVIIAITSSTYFFASDFVNLLFSKNFSLAASLLPWQSLGDGLRALSLVIGFVGLSRGNLIIHAAAELIQGGIMLIAGLLLIKQYGAIGASYAHLITYAIYFPICLIAYKIYINNLPTIATLKK